MRAGEHEANILDRVQLGLLPQGTGGDFRRTLGLPHRLDAYLEALAGSRSRKLDVGELSYSEGGVEKSRYFVNILSVGMSGLVDTLVADTSKALGGTLAYFGASLKALARSKVGVLGLGYTDPDGGEHEREVSTFAFAVCNGQYFGSGMHCAPKADPFDGIFDLVALGPQTKLDMILDSQAIYKGKHLDHPKAWTARATVVTIELKSGDRDSFLTDCDGEPLPGPPVRIGMRKGILTLRA
jgi:diacylglycerol kinase family enzyme